MRILHGPVNIANQPWWISRYERKLGHKSDVVINYSTKFGYPFDICLGEYQKKSRIDILKRYLFSIAAPFRYHVLHYYFGRSLFCWDDYGVPNENWFKDLRLAKSLGKKVFFTLQGCDVRLAGESNKRNKHTPCRDGYCNSYQGCIEFYDQQRNSLIENILPLCDKVFFLNPELGHFVPNATFLPYASVDLEEIKPLPIKNEDRIKILHAPSDGSTKGTPIVLKAIEQLKDKYPIDFMLIQNLPHKEAMKAYRDADIVIDQLLYGWYGGFAVELMAMGKPVACYIREEDLDLIPKRMKEELPLLRVSAENLVEELSSFIEQRGMWAEWSRKSVEFVNRWHNPKYIAQALLEAYKSPKSKFDLEKFFGG